MSELDKSTEAGRLTEVDYIEQFYSAAAGFQETLDELGPENTSIELRVSIVRELDAMCPFAGEVVCANDLAVMPKFDEDDDYAGTHGTIIYHDLLMENGDKIQLGKKTLQ